MMVSAPSEYWATDQACPLSTYALCHVIVLKGFEHRSFRYLVSKREERDTSGVRRSGILNYRRSVSQEEDSRAGLWQALRHEAESKLPKEGNARKVEESESQGVWQSGRTDLSVAIAGWPLTGLLITTA